MTEDELKRLEALCEEATPGPWSASDFDVDPGPTLAARVATPGGVIEMGRQTIAGPNRLFADAEFIAAARAALPAALAEIRLLRAENARLRALTVRIRDELLKEADVQFDRTKYVSPDQARLNAWASATLLDVARRAAHLVPGPLFVTVSRLDTEDTSSRSK